MLERIDKLVFPGAADAERAVAAGGAGGGAK